MDEMQLWQNANGMVLDVAVRNADERTRFILYGACCGSSS